MHAKRVDANHAAVRDEIRAVLPDATVRDLSGAGNGLPDLLVGWGGRNWLFEVKDPSKPPSKRKLTPAQRELLDGWQGQAAVVHSAAEAIVAMLRAVTTQRLRSNNGND